MGNSRDNLESWLAPFVSALGHKTRGRMCPACVARLIGPGDRKSVQPMAGRDWKKPRTAPATNHTQASHP
ncbi:hypothetical protein SAMN05444398_107173 [Roseovarius pacificus]|uniref:Uncharacterized protein n=1 Tax=Roseovarius pacificus TaxID=337701 RepID=A0A1M7ERJ3_9RHOB|nr:hypothetical protein GCM10011315_25040 [Roseovarius pacificus]SHL94119.1 hypothetical protein SAMN05444398_107173 [Roseovarius pacificus]